MSFIQRHPKLRRKKWNIIDKPHDEISNGKITKMSNNILIIATLSNGIYKYYVDIAKWEFFFAYRKNWIFSKIDISYDRKRNKLYIYGDIYQWEIGIVIIDMKTKEFNIVNLGSNHKNSCICDVGDEIHFVSTWGHHCVYNKKSQQFLTMHQFPQNIDSIIYPSTLLHISSLNALFLLGTESYITRKGKRATNGLLFSLETREWKQIPNLVVTDGPFSTLLTKNEKHIILIPVYDVVRAKDTFNDIFIININDDGAGGYILSKSNITLPTLFQQFRTIRMSVLAESQMIDEFLVYGYLKQSEAFPILRCKYILILISSFLNMESLHVIGIDEPAFGGCNYSRSAQHFIISVCDILKDAILIKAPDTELREMGWNLMMNTITTELEFGDITQMDDNTFIITTFSTGQGPMPGIYKYYIDSKHCELFLAYPKGLQFYKMDITYDRMRNMLYLHGDTYGGDMRIVIVNMITKQLEIVNDKLNGRDASICDAGDEIHFVSGWHGTHVVYNKNTKQFKLLDQSFNCVYGSTLLYIQSKQSLFLLGRLSNGYEKDKKHVINGLLFSLETKKWQKIPNLVFNDCAGVTLLTKNEKYIIIVCGGIFIINIEDDGSYILRKSKIGLPFVSGIGKKMCVLAESMNNNELFVYGYSRMFGVQIPSDDILKLISSYIYVESLHIIRMDYEVPFHSKCKVDHLVISVNEILKHAIST